jgi:hypothetical protein
LYINTRKIQVIALAFFALLPPDTFQPSACESPRGNATVFDILHTLGTSCQALHRAIAHTLARLRVRDFLTHLMSLDTSSPVPRWCVPRPILVLLAHRRPPRSLLPPADQHHLRSSHQAAGAYYAPAAYKVYEAESAVTAAETALSALNARIKSVRRDPDPTPSALGQISSILPTVPRGAQYCLLPTVQPADTRRVHPNPSPTHNRSTTPTSRAPRRP